MSCACSRAYSVRRRTSDLGRLRIGTRESKLSRAQTRTVVDMLSGRNPGLEIEVVPIKTLGDRLPPEKRNAVDGKTAFTGDIESLLLSGEYSMIKAASLNGWLDEKAAAMEVLTSIKRAGADITITYFAEQVAGWLKEER